MNEESRLDLSALDPGADPTRVERCASAVAARVAPALRRRRERRPLLWLELAQWQRPVLAAAVLIAVASIFVLAAPRRGSLPSSGMTPGTLAEAEGLPTTIASWVESGAPLSSDALLGMQETP
jgi:hypothetical protein